MLSNEHRENHVGKNIRSLREFYREKLEDLAFNLDIDVSDISRYENGKRYPNHKTLEKIARHYCITLDELIYGDFSRLRSDFLQFTDPQKINELSDTLFPIVCSEKALRDEWFQKAYMIHIRIFEHLKKGISYSEKEMNECLTCYGNSCKNLLFYREGRGDFYDSCKGEKSDGRGYGIGVFVRQTLQGVCV